MHANSPFQAQAYKAIAVNQAEMTHFPNMILHDPSGPGGRLSVIQLLHNALHECRASMQKLVHAGGCKKLGGQLSDALASLSIGRSQQGMQQYLRSIILTLLSFLESSPCQLLQLN